MVQPDGVLDTSPPADINAREHPSYLPPDVDSIKIFMPSWFVANMGTGVVSSLLWSFPYGPRSILHTLGTVFLALNIILFAIFCVLSTIRSFQHPKLISLTLRHPVQSFYLGCLPMGFATIINTTLDINQNYGFGGESLLYTLWGLWWLDSIASLAVYSLVLYAMVTRQNPTVKTPTVVWLLPAVTPIVPSTTGAFLARAILPHSTNHAILTLFMSTVLLFLGLSLAFMILPLHVLQLITEGLPKNTLVASKLLFVGPCGQGGATFIIIGQVFAEIGRRRLSDHILLSESQPWTPLGLACGFFLWTLGTWWVLPSISGVYEALRWDPPDVAPEFWGMVFPLGVYAFLTLQLSQALDSTLLQRLASTLSVAVFLLWGFLAAATIHQTLRNRKQFFSAPHGFGSPHDLSPDGLSQPPLLGKSGGGRIRI